jgi:hypothetical protein
MYFIHTCLLQTYYDKTQLDFVIFNVVRFRDFMSVIYRGLENKHYRKPKSRMDNQETPAQWTLDTERRQTEMVNNCTYINNASSHI